MCIIRQTLIYVHPVLVLRLMPKKQTTTTTKKYISRFTHQRLCWNIYWDAIFYNRLSAHVALRHIAFFKWIQSSLFETLIFYNVSWESLCKYMISDQMDFRPFNIFISQIIELFLYQILIKECFKIVFFSFFLIFLFNRHRDSLLL